MADADDLGARMVMDFAEEIAHVRMVEIDQVQDGAMSK